MLPAVKGAGRPICLAYRDIAGRPGQLVKTCCGNLPHLEGLIDWLQQITKSTLFSEFYMRQRKPDFLL